MLCYRFVSSLARREKQQQLKLIELENLDQLTIYSSILIALAMAIIEILTSVSGKIYAPLCYMNNRTL